MRRVFAICVAVCLLLAIVPARSEILAKRGDQSETVSLIQQALIDRGYLDGSADGVFGRNTENAVRSFQQAEGLKVDGLVGTETYARLTESTPAPSASAAPAPTPAPTPEKAFDTASPRADGSILCTFDGVRAQANPIPGGYLIVLTNEGAETVEVADVLLRYAGGEFAERAELLLPGRENAWFAEVPQDASVRGMRLSTGVDPALIAENRMAEIACEVVLENGDAHVCVSNLGSAEIQRVSYTLVYRDEAGNVLAACEERDLFGLPAGETVESVHSGAPEYALAQVYLNRAAVYG
ncbi:MAG: peptidoglycan-binding protein [Clostridia bacterium]|nr:peptidoglycan-binding protein [Clostridia bacterium]